MSSSMDIDKMLRGDSIPFKFLTFYLAILYCPLSAQRDETFALIDVCDMDVTYSISDFIQAQFSRQLNKVYINLLLNSRHLKRAKVPAQF